MYALRNWTQPLALGWPGELTFSKLFLQMYSEHGHIGSEEYYETFIEIVIRVHKINKNNFSFLFLFNILFFLIFACSLHLEVE
jgi:hypothetical protein